MDNNIPSAVLGSQITGVEDAPGPITPFSADTIKPQPQIMVNDYSGKEPDLSLAFSDLAGMKEATAAKEKQMEDIKSKIQEKEKEKSSIWNIIKSKEQEDVKSETEGNIGFDMGEYLVTRKQDIAEMESLQKQYQDILVLKENEQLSIENRPGFTKSIAEREWTYAEKKWNSRLNAIAGGINTKAAIMKLKDENYTQAQQYINQAINYHTQELENTYKQFDKIQEENKELWNNLSENQKDVYNTAKDFALQEYQTARAEKTQIGNLMSDYPDAPWDSNSMNLSLGEATQIAQQSAKYQKEMQGDVLGDIYKGLQIEKLQQEIRANESDLESGQLNEKELKAIDTSSEGKNVQTLVDLKNKVNRYKTLLDEYGYQFSGAGRTLLEGAYAELKIAWKEAAKLGALTGPDVAIIADAVKPATGFTGAFAYATGGGIGGIKKGVETMLKNIDTDANRNVEQLLARNEKYKGSNYVGLLASNFGITVISPDGTEGVIPSYEWEEAKKQGYKKK